MEDNKKWVRLQIFFHKSCMFSTVFLVLNNALIYMSKLFLECPFPKIHNLLPALIYWYKATKLFWFVYAGVDWLVGLLINQADIWHFDIIGKG